MLSFPDFKEKQILFVKAGQNGGNEKIKINNENIAYLKDGKIINQLSAHKVFALFIIGEASVTTGLIKKCRELGVSLFLLKNNFEVYGKVIAEAEGNYLLRQRQYGLNEAKELVLAKNVVKNKLLNQLALLKQNNLIISNEVEAKEKIIQQKISLAASGKELLGLEGAFTKEYFAAFFKEMNWHKRLPRTKVDITNLLMDIGYTFLFNFIEAMLALYGFDAYKGFYHKLFFQRKSLACDLMEPFRCLIDKQIVKAYHLKQINEKDFKLEKGRYFLPFDKQQKYIKLFLDGLMDYKEGIFIYVYDFYRCLMNDDKELPSFKIK